MRSPKQIIFVLIVFIEGCAVNRGMTFSCALASQFLWRMTSSLSNCRAYYKQNSDRKAKRSVLLSIQQQEREQSHCEQAHSDATLVLFYLPMLCGHNRSWMEVAMALFQKKRQIAGKKWTFLALLLLLVLLVGCGGTASQATPTPEPFTKLSLGIPVQALNAPVVGPVPATQVLHVGVTFKIEPQILDQMDQH